MTLEVPEASNKFAFEAPGLRIRLRFKTPRYGSGCPLDSLSCLLRIAADDTVRIIPVISVLFPFADVLGVPDWFEGVGLKVARDENR